MIEVDCDLKYETDKAYLIVKGDQEYWLPKSQVETDCTVPQNGGTIYVPEWLAIEKGLV